MFLNYVVQNENLSINKILKIDLNISSRLYYKLIKNKLVYLNEQNVDTRTIPQIGDKILIDLNYKEDNSNIIATKIDLNIIYEDDCFIVIDKPSGIAVHPSILHFDDTLSNGLKFYFDSINLQKKIRPVNRLDFFTSGLVIFAKNEYIQECLIKQMENHTFEKIYLGLAKGILEPKKGTLNMPIARKDNSIIERCISVKGKNSITHYEVLEEYKNVSLVKFILETGRTHQIRVHMSSINHPLIGDSLYGETSPFYKGQALCCYKLKFIHPITKKLVIFTSSNDFIQNPFNLKTKN